MRPTPFSLRPLAIVVALAGVAGCAPASRLAPRSLGADAPNQYLNLKLPGSARQVKMVGNDVYGVHARLTFYEDGIRGVIDNKLASFEVQGDTIRGTVGGAPVELHLREGEDDAFSVRGLFRGYLSRLQVSPEGVFGVLGGCGYLLRPHGTEPGVYAGRRVCAQGFGGAELSLPPAFAARSAAERAVILSLLLTGA